MAAATLLSGFSGVAIAAAAGCSGFAGSLGGREVVPWQLLLLPVELPRTGEHTASPNQEDLCKRPFH